MDITIDIGVGVADNGTVVLVDDMIAVLIYEVHIASLEEDLVAIFLDQVFTISSGFGRIAVNTVGLVAVEHTYGLTYLGLNGGAIKIGLEGPVVVGQSGHLVLIVAYRGTDFPMEVLQVEHLDHGMRIETVVLEFSFVTPVDIKTAGPCQLLQGKQVAGPALEEVETQIQTVVEEVTLHACREARCGLPFQLGVANVTDDNTCSSAVQHAT